MTGTRINATLLKLLFNICLVFIVATTVNIRANAKNVISGDEHKDHLPFDVSPLHYNVSLKPYNNVFYGETSILIQVQKHTREISLHMEELEIDFKTISLSKHRQKRGKQPHGYSYSNKTKILVLQFDDVTPDKYILNITFTGSLLGNKGFVAINYEDQRGQTSQSYVTLFEPTGARRAFPCWDESTWKSTYKISVIHPITYGVWSNMPRLKKSLIDKNRVQTIFETTPKMPVQYLTIAVIEAERVDLPHKGYQYPKMGHINIWCTLGKKKQMQMTHSVVAKIANVITEDLGFTWQGSTINIIAFPNFPTKIVGSWGLAVVREKDVVDKGIFIGHQIEEQRTVAHLIIRQFIETFASTATLCTEWVKKALAIYLSYFIMEEGHLYRQMMDHFVMQVHQLALHNSIGLNPSDLIYETEPFFHSLIVNKASAVMRMVQYMIKKEVFIESLAEYFRSGHSCTANDLWHFLQSKTSWEPYNLEIIMQGWLRHANYPVLSIEQHEPYNEAPFMYITQYPYLSKDTYANMRWIIPLTYIEQSELTSQDISTRQWLTKQFVKLSISNQNEWIILNTQQTGFYRVNYDSYNWLKIVNYLNEEDHTVIHHLNRAQLIDDAYHFMMEEKINHMYFPKLINYLWKEHDYTPWHAMANVLHYMSPFFNFPESRYYKDHILKIFTKFITAWRDKEIYGSKATATPILIMNWACKLGEFNCRETAHEIFMLDFANYMENLIIPGWDNWVYCAGLMNANSSTWNRVAFTFVQNKTEMLKYLACTENDIVVHEFLRSITSEITGILSYLKYEQLLKLYHGIMKRHARKDVVLDFVLTNFEQLLPGPMSALEKIGSVIMNVYSECQLNQILNFVTHNGIWDTKALTEIIRLRKIQLQKQRHKFLLPFNLQADEEDC